MGTESVARAPTVVIETVMVVRPIKVLGVMCGIIAVLLLMLSVAASAWVRADGSREGLWDRCNYNKTNDDYIDCDYALEKTWRTACQGLTLACLAITICAIVITSLGLRTADFHYKYKLYWAGLIVFFIAVGVQLTSLIVFPIKMLDEIPNREEAHWNFGWAYVIGWCAAVSDFIAGLFLLLDKDAEEILYKERVVHDDARNGIEASEDV